MSTQQCNMVGLPPFHFMVLVGLMLSDACIQKVARMLGWILVKVCFFQEHRER